MKTERLPNEQIVKQGLVDLKKGFEAVSGKLYLTNQRLIHESAKLVIQKGVTIIPCKDVTAVCKSWVKILNLIPIAPMSFTVTTRDGTNYEFVHISRGAWKKAIEEVTGCAGGSTDQVARASSLFMW